MQSFDLPFERIKELDLERRIIGRRLTLVCRNAEDLGDFPLPAWSINEFKCSVKRKYRSMVDLWSAEVLMRLAEQA